MSDNLKDILSNLNPDIDQETLLLYLQGKLSAEKQHEIEKHMIDNEFEADAMEGLQNVNSSQRISLIVDQLNHDLRKRTAKKKLLREKRVLKIDTSIWYAILVLLLLVVLSYFVIHHLLNK